MRIRAVVVMLASLVAFSASAAHAQTVKLATLSAEQREEVTLSPAELPSPACSIGVRPGARPFTSYLEDDAIKAILDSLSPNAAGKYVLYAMRVDTAGVVNGRLLESTLPAEDLARVNTAISSAVAARGDTTTIVFRLRLDPGSTDRPVRVAPSVNCMPYLANTAEVERALDRVAPRGGDPTRRKPFITRVMLFVDADGKVTESEVKESSGDFGIDRSALNAFVRAARFIPASIEGLIMPIWATINLHTWPRR